MVQVMFTMNSEQWGELRLGELSVEGLQAKTSTAKFDLSVFVNEDALSLRGAWKYDEALWQAPTMRRMLEHWRHVLETMVSADGLARGVWELDLLSEQERYQLLVMWSGNARPYERKQGLAELFALQVARHGEQIAVGYEGETLTYAALDRRSNRLARYLRRQGVTRETIVGLALERSIDLVIAVLAILKAGGAYLPLDPAYPGERLRYMVENADVPVIVGRRAEAQGLDVSGRTAVWLDDATTAVAIAHESDEALAPIGGGDDLAYIIYTSGSTGRPKGVAIEQHSVTRLIRHTDYVRLDAEDCIAQMATVSFDISTFEIWGALINGARLEVAPPRMFVADEIRAFIRDRGITVINLATSLFHLVVEEAPDVLADLKYLLAGGDVLLPTHVQRAAGLLRNGQMVNAYGPTETTTIACTYRASASDAYVRGVPIGTAITNARVYILDERMAPVPVGVYGELYIGGDGVARGYVNRPDLTAERFVPDPFGAQGARLYRTGDICRYRTDGQIEFMGRRDHQVKIRGFRIELGEVDALLRQHPAVRDCVVLVKDVQGDRRLAAYVVADREIGAAEIKRHLHERAPDYMVPSQVHRVERIPLNASGKTDRAALLAMEGSDGDETRGETRTPIEEILAGIWCQVLGVERVGPSDHFFELGGHSLLATQVMARVRDSLGVTLPVRMLFEHAQLQQLADMIEYQRSGGTAEPVAIVRVERGDEAAASYGQQRLWFLDQLAAGHAFYNMPSVFRLRGTLDADVLEASLLAIRARHDVLRTHFVTVDGEPVQVVEPETDWRLVREPVTDEATLTADMDAEAQRPFDLSQGPLMRAHLWRVGEA
ncbi:MAG TPA: amino acid adenylation domain-containing protein, partial [Dyella sp.]|uniref:non-ribosomal peptide synthetase n=1 Tax=Dyella sp. TaxID=1869338 RepID=UPI002CAFA937